VIIVPLSNGGVGQFKMFIRSDHACTVRRADAPVCVDVEHGWRDTTAELDYQSVDHPKFLISLKQPTALDFRLTLQPEGEVFVHPGAAYTLARGKETGRWPATFDAVCSTELTLTSIMGGAVRELSAGDYVLWVTLGATAGTIVRGSLQLQLNANADARVTPL
jgi:hypothetical protein